MTRLLELWRDGALTRDDVFEWVKNHKEGPTSGAYITENSLLQCTQLAGSILSLYLWSRKGYELSGALRKIASNNLMYSFERLDPLHWSYLNVILSYLKENAPEDWNKAMITEVINENLGKPEQDLREGHLVALVWRSSDVEDMFLEEKGREPTKQEIHEVLTEFDNELHDRLTHRGNDLMREIINRA